MKKFVIVIALVAILATGTAFADHPDGFGIGLVGGMNFRGMGGAGGLSLKIPSIPIFWAINLWGGSNYFRVGLTGDYYIIDQNFAPMFHWFFGLGGFFDFYNWSYKFKNSLIKDYSYTYLDFGVRVPIGISFQPIPLLEIWLDVAPSLGLGFWGGQSWKVGTYEHKEDPRFGFFWGIPLEIGLRLWF